MTEHTEHLNQVEHPEHLVVYRSLRMRMAEAVTGVGLGFALALAVHSVYPHWGLMLGVCVLLPAVLVPLANNLRMRRGGAEHISAAMARQRYRAEVQAQNPIAAIGLSAIGFTLLIGGLLFVLSGPEHLFGDGRVFLFLIPIAGLVMALLRVKR